MVTTKSNATNAVNSRDQYDPWGNELTDREKEISYRLSNAQQMMYYARNSTGAQKKHWIDKAEEWAYQAVCVPKDYKAPEFKMPSWGTYGT